MTELRKHDQTALAFLAITILVFVENKVTPLWKKKQFNSASTGISLIALFIRMQ